MSTNSFFATIATASSKIIPIERHEWKKFLPMAFIMFFAVFNHALLRSLKDTLLIPSLGAEAISFTKLYAVTPSAILFMLIYTRMTSSLGPRKIFYCFASFFLAYYLLFVWTLYPQRHLLHPNPDMIAALQHQSIDLLFFKLSLAHFKWFIKLYGSWTIVMFYVLAELWTALILSLLFWQFANSTTKTSEAKRFYPMLGLIANIGLIVCGKLTKYFSGSENRITILVMFAAFAAFMIMVLYYYINNYVLNDPKYAPVHTVSSLKKDKPGLSFFKGLKVVFSSKYIGLIAILLLSYGASINLVEGPWKNQVRELYPDENTYLYFMGSLQEDTGLITMAIMFFGAHILKRIKWKTGAMLTPLMILITGGGFFTLVVFDKYVHEAMSLLFGMTAIVPIVLAVKLGFWQNIASKGTKYAFFDATKEMAYIPVDKELQTKGKAAADVVAGRFAKSFGAIIQSTLFMLFPAATFATIAPYLMGMFFVIIIMWIVAVNMLSKEYEACLSEGKLVS